MREISHNNFWFYQIAQHTIILYERTHAEYMTSWCSVKAAKPATAAIIVREHTIQHNDNGGNTSLSRNISACHRCGSDKMNVC